MTWIRSGNWMAALMMGLGVLALGTSAGAEGGLTLEERVQRLEQRAEMPPQQAAPSGLDERITAIEEWIRKWNLEFHGMIVGSYQYDLNDPDEHNNVVGLRAFDRDHNSFTLDLAQIQFNRSAGEDGGVGFMIKLNFGKVAERMAADWDGDGTIGGTSEEDNSVELEEAYITYNFPGLPALQLKGGKFVTLHGAEVIESPLNFNVSRSLAFSFAIPFTHTGLMLNYQVNDQVHVHGGVVNGWDNVVDSNDGKSFHGGVMLTPVEQFAITIGGMYGPEQPDREGSHRALADVVMTIKPVDVLTISLNYDYGNESNLGPNRDDTAEWNAASGIVALDFADMPLPIGFAVRGEYFDDSDGTRLGPVLGQHQSAWEVTGTFKIMLYEGLMARAEYRYDNVESENPVFLRDVGGVQEDQHTVAAELSYVFGWPPAVAVAEAATLPPPPPPAPARPLPPPPPPTERRGG